MKKLALVFLISAMSFTTVADDFAQTKMKLEQALKSDLRSAKEKARDANRKPIETLAFFGLRDNMRVIELIPGAGWYSKLLAPTLKENGQYYAVMNANRIKDQLLVKPGFEKAIVLEEKASYWRDNGSAYLTADIETLGADNVDMVLTFRNYQNFNEIGRKSLNEAVYKALKPGGIYGLVSHTARHMEPPNNENRRRFDPVLAMKEILEAGFEFIDFSDLHYRSQDSLTLEVGDKKVTGQTDRWTLKFRKPLTEQ
ncbi:class I SAM-dependent methyltransferase [Alteromonas sp. a30]|uniref:class I SAM-dependent methyltransferase n=1 Tax=Alteromonas sp. a30 TaxID=2730917 RepID=UPI0022808158|nr:methyltransferase [Alteromonas sp. a30]MCY7294850.1 class I SAM-dependent methyltransferase [Alteromonas sp. a30]